MVWLDWHSGLRRHPPDRAVSRSRRGSPEVQVYAVPLCICRDSAADATVPARLNITRTCVPKAALKGLGASKLLDRLPALLSITAVCAGLGATLSVALCCHRITRRVNKVDVMNIMLSVREPVYVLPSAYLGKPPRNIRAWYFWELAADETNAKCGCLTS